MQEKIEDEMEKGTSGLSVRVVEIEDPSVRKQNSRQRHSHVFSLFLRRSLNRRDSSESPWPKLFRRTLYLLSVITALLVVGFIIYHSLLLALVRRLSPPQAPANGLTEIVASWAEPGNATNSPAWLPSFSRDVTPKAIHSHNDYWRRVPLFEALSLGITGVEADCHLINGELYVAHTNSSIQHNRTFKSLYVDPLSTILENQNTGDDGSSTNGIWDVDQTAGIILLTDLKTEGFSTLSAVQEQLKPFRRKGWLTYWNGTHVVPGPITHVATGNTPFAAVLNSTFSNATYRTVFFDAPLHSLSSTDQYNISNSFYSSTSLASLFHGERIPDSGLKKHQYTLLKAQIDEASSLGLVSRYWDIPAWPVARRMRIWRQLEEMGVGMLNVDAVEVAARWNWRVCGVFGLELC